MRIACLLIVLVSFSLSANRMIKDPTRPANKVVENIGENGEEIDPNSLNNAAPGENGQLAFPNTTLSAIVVTDDLKYAIINNEVVYEGQQWRNVQLKKVQPYSITLAINDQEKEIIINKNDFIKESNENF